MAVRTITNAVEYACDAPTCSFSIILNLSDVPDGYRGEVEAMTAASGAGSKKRWMACRADHIEPAVKAVLDLD